ncbi:MAG: FxsA family protein [Solirubrobacterales bacterium]|nr:FxsA family protein [Solirubrobacterales bacterium]
MPLLLLLIVVVPLVEIYVLIRVGQAIGALWTVALLLADSFLGAALMRSQGRRAWTTFAAALGQGRVPAKETLDGALVIFGGAFLITPGFVSDIFGFLLLLPPTRAVIRRLVLRSFTSRFSAAMRAGQFVTGRGGGGPGVRRPSPFARSDADVEGTAYDVDDPRALPPHPDGR